QSVVAYSVIGWALIQVAGETFVNLGLPGWTVPAVIFSIVGGFPVVVLLSWFLEMSHGRMERDEGQHEGGIWKGLERNYLAIVAAYVIAAVGAAVYQVTVGFADPEEASSRVALTDMTPTLGESEELLPIAENSIAVLRFNNLDESDTTRIFANGLSEDILDRIARVPGLLVPSRGDCWSLSPDATSDEVRRRLRVAYYVEGSVRIDDDQITVVAQLIDTASGFHVLSKSIRRQLTRYSEIQPDLTSLIVAELRVALPEDVQMASLPSEEPVVDAYVAYRRGKDVLDSPRTLDSIDRAVEHFQEALSIDPDYAAANAGLCGAETARYQITGTHDDIELAERYCASALLNAPRLSLVHRASGNMLYRTGRLEEAAIAYSNALEINERDADSMLGLARVNQRKQSYSDAQALIETAIDLQPGNWRAYNRLGALQFSLGQYTDAAESYRRVVYLDPNNFVALGNMATSRMMAGDFVAAKDIFESSLKIEESPSALSNLGILYYYLGDFDQAVAMHRRSAEATPDHESVWVNLGDALHFAGKREQATVAFERGAELARARTAADSRDAEALCYLAWAETMLGNESEGQRLTELVLSIAPDDPYSYYYRALVLAQVGDIETASIAASRAVELGYSVKMLEAEPYLQTLLGSGGFSELQQ
ncbi:MAG: tetratricopeptide repeat protein, partial [Pseudomonadota bacterium]